MALEGWQQEVLERAQEVIGIAAIRSKHLPGNLDFSDLEALDLYLRSELFEFRLDASQELTAETLRAISAALAEAHEAAAAVVVGAPSAADIERYKEKLEAVHRDVQLDQRSRQLTAFAGKVADLLGDLA